METPVIRKKLDEAGRSSFDTKRYYYFVECRRERKIGFSDSLWIIRRKKGDPDEEVNMWISLDQKNENPEIEYHSYDVKHKLTKKYVGTVAAARKAGEMLSQIKRSLAFQQPPKVK